MKRIILISCFVLLSKSIWSQTDTLFYFAAPEITQSNTNFDRPILLRITSYSSDATVSISQPANESFTEQIISVTANTLMTVDLTEWIDSIENKPSNSILDYGIKIESSHKITVYYEVQSSCQCNPEIYVLKGQTAFGNDFWIPSQNMIANDQQYKPVSNSSFDIVATSDETLVEITPSNDIVGHSANETFTIELNEGQTFSSGAVSGDADKHLNGSRVISNKPIAITIKDDLLQSTVYGGCSDQGGDQIVPTSQLGTEYVAVNGFLNNIGDQLFILATEDETLISQNGNDLATINAGETLQVDVGDTATYILTSKPSSVLQISGFGCEYGIDILPNLNCTGTESVALARSTSEPFFINLVVPNGGQDGFIINDDPDIVSESQFEPIDGTNDNWYYAQIELNQNILPIGESVLINNPATFHLSVIHGGANTGTRFGYFSDFGCPNLSLNDKNINDKIEIYPNPTNDYLYIENSEESMSNLEIFNILGGKVNQVKFLNEGTNTLDVSKLSKGIYFVKITSQSKTSILQFIKK